MTISKEEPLKRLPALVAAATLLAGAGVAALVAAAPAHARLLRHAADGRHKKTSRKRRRA